MKYSFSAGTGDCVNLPAAFCGPTLDNAPVLALKALLALAADGECESKSLCERFSCEERELAAALAYWVDCGLLSRCAGKLTCAADQTDRKAVPAEINSSKAAPERLPVLSSAEATAKIAADPELKFLLEQTANVFGRLLSQSETTHIISIIEYSGLSPDIMLMLIEYCAQGEKKTLAYIKKVAMDWAERGITSHEAVNAEIMRLTARGNAAAQVKRILRITDRALSGGECDYAAKWLGELGFDGEMVSRAYEICVTNTGKCDFRYIDRVLCNWKSRGIDSADKIEENNAKHKKENKKLPAPDDDDFYKNALRKRSLT